MKKVLVFGAIIILLIGGVCVYMMNKINGTSKTTLVDTKPSERTFSRVSVHDPSIVKADGRYYIFGSHLAVAYTDNLSDWANLEDSTDGYSENNRLFDTFLTQFKEGATWSDTVNKKNYNGMLWAPDVIWNEAMSKWCMYMSVNGDDWKSSITLSVADDVQGPYTTVGTIVYSGFYTQDRYERTDAPMVLKEDVLPQRYQTIMGNANKWGDHWPNVIDPCVFYDEDGVLWMTYGSWSGGIFMLKLDEKTGLRDYTYTYESKADETSDEYFGFKIAGGKYVSGEGSYIIHAGDYYYLFVTYGGLVAEGGYNMRLFRSANPTGPYVDAQGNSALFTRWYNNFNSNIGLKLMGGYKFDTMKEGQVAQGHNSALVDEDGRIYLIYHTRFDTGSQYHQVRVHQMFMNENGWLTVAPYEFSGEKIVEKGLKKEDIVGEYELIVHKLAIKYALLETVKSERIFLNEDGTISGAVSGNWSVEKSTVYIKLSFDNIEYNGVILKQAKDVTLEETTVFTAVGANNVSVWGSKVY